MTEASLAERPAVASYFSFTPGGIVRAVRRYRGRAILVFGSSVLLGLAATLLTQPVYESATLLLVRFGQQQVYRTPVGPDSNPIAPADSQLSDNMVNTQVQLLQSRDVIEPVIERIGIARLYPDIAGQQVSEIASPPTAGWLRILGSPARYVNKLYWSIAPPYLKWFSRGSEMDRAVRQFLTDLSIQQARASLLLQVTYRNPNPALAQLALTRLIEEHRRLSAAVDGGERARFYASALVQMQSKLSDAEARLNRFRSEVGVVAFKEQLSMLLQQRQKLEEQRGSLIASLAGVDRSNTKLLQQLKALPPNVVAYTETHTASHQMGVTRTERSPVLTEVESAIQQGDTERAALSGHVEEIEKQLQSVDAQIQRASNLDGTRIILENDVASTESSIRNLTLRADDAALLDELGRHQSSSLSVAQAPTQPDVSDPVRPTPLRYMAIAIATGLLGAVTIAVGSMMFAGQPTDRQFNLSRRPRAPILPL
jgi:uncharacterized protein involved in exopolysaccharide biosynthesis